MRNHNLLVPTTTTSSSSSKNNVANKQQQEPPHLSGAYIRSLVKQLSSSSSTARSNKDHTTTMGTKPHGCHPQPDQEPQTPPPPQPQPQPHKKQVRRRLHTSRPYQERLLNMAEARREIVTALKIHRASMRQAKEQQQLLHLQHQQQQQQQEVATQVAAAASVQEQQTVQQAAATRSASAAAMHHGYASFSDYLYNSPLTYFSPAYSSPLPYHAPLPPPAALAPPMAAAQLAHGDLLPLPAQPLGLNLSFHGFSSVVADVDGGDGDGGKGSSTSCLDPHPLFHQPSPASSYSVYSSPSVTTTAAGQDMSSSALTTAENTSLAAAELAEADPSLHRVLDDEEMAAIYSIGEQHDIEWSDTVNLVTSAWWSKLLDTVEGGGGGGDAGAAAGQLEPAAGGALNASAAAEDELTVTRMPDWFGDGGLLGHHQSTKESGSDVLGMHFSEYYHHGHGSYGEDVSLPRMDLGEIEGWNAEWFS